MKLLRWFFLSWLLLVAGVTLQSQAYWQSRQQVSVGPAVYAGPGDIASFAMWWGLRCYSSTYAGNVADVYAPADASHTLITCSAGGTLNQTLQALSVTCASSCTIKTLYDQSGNTVCSATACDVTNATIANRPALTLSCIGSLFCATFTGSNSQVLQSANAMATNFCPQPLSQSIVAKRTGAFTTLSTILGSDGGQVQTGFNSTANNVFIFANGSIVPVSAADSAWHALQVVYNGTSSSVDVDGTTTGSLSPGIDGLNPGTGQKPSVGAAAAANFLTGTFAEGGHICSTLSGGNQTALNSQQHLAWGF